MSKGFFDFHVHPTIKPFGRTAGKILRKGFLSKTFDQKITGCPIRKFGTEFNSELVWDSICYIADHCTFHINREPSGGHIDLWSCISIGSDYDGLINPVNKFPTLGSFPLLEKHLLSHIKRWHNEEPTLLHELTTDASEQLVERIMFGNGIHFLKINLKS